MRFCLKTKAATAIALLILVTVAVVTTVQTRLIRSELIERVSGMHAALVAGAARTLDQKLETALLAITGAAQVIPADVMGRPQELPGYLQRQPALLLLFDALLLFSPTGEVLADAPVVAGRRGIQAGEREYFKRGVATLKPVVSTPYLGRGARRPIVTMIAPILDAEGRLAGFLGGNLDLLQSHLLGNLATTPIGQAGYFFAITKDQPSVYIFHQDRKLVLTPSLASGPASANEQALAGREGTVRATEGEGEPGLYSYKSLRAANWLLASSYPLAEALAPMIAAERRLWTLSALLALVLAPFAWLLAWYMIAPLLRLRDDAQRLHRMGGNISHDLRTRKDEIGDLARDFHALIVERQRSAEAQRRSTQLLDNIVENIPVGIQLKAVDDDLRIVLWNKASEAIWGLPRERAIGQTALEFWSPEDVDHFREADLLAVASLGQSFMNRPGTAADGRAIITHLRKVPLFDAAGVATHLLVIADDVTDRVAAETRLAQSEASLRGAAESALDAFFILDSVRDAAGEIRDFRFRYLNGNAERLIAQPDGQAIGRLLGEVLPYQHTDGHFARYAEVVRSGMPLDEEYEVNSDQVDATWLHHQVVRLEDGIAVTARDISSRRAAEAETRSNRSFLQSLIDNLPLAIYVKDVRPASFGTMVVWNGGAEIMSGIPAQQALGRTDSEIFGADVYGQIEEHDRELLASPMVSEIAYHPFTRPDGAHTFLHTISVPLFGVDDRPEFILRISEDVTVRRQQQKELRERTAELMAVSDASPLGMFRTDAEGRRTYVNRTYELLAGLTAEEAMAERWTSAVHPDDRVRVLAQWKAAVAAQQPFASLHRYQHRGGRVVWASVKAARVVSDGKVLGYVGSVVDFTARRETERALQASEHRLRTITDTMPAWIAYIDRQEIYRFTNAAFERAFSLTRSQVEGCTVREILGDVKYMEVKPHLDRVFAGQSVTFEREQALPEGIRWVEATYIPEIDEESKAVLGFHSLLRDVTGQKLEQQRLLRLSQVDSLTGLANRVGFEQRLLDAMDQSRKSGQVLAVMYIDIDYFKRINDTSGHATGDALLLAFAQRLRTSLRKTDMVARLGGDEFVVVMEHMHDMQSASRLARKALQAIRRPFVLAVDGSVHSVSASIGVAFFHGGEASAAQLVAEADALLYAAKKRGRNHCRLAPWPSRTRTVATAAQ